MKKSELRQLIREEIQSSSKSINKITNEGVFGTSFEKEKRKIEDALERWVKYSMDNGDSEDDVLSVGGKYLRDAVSIYLGGKIDDEELDDLFKDVMSKIN